MTLRGGPDAQGGPGFAIARAGFPFIFAAAFATVIFALLDLDILAIVGLLGTFFGIYFFRDPERTIPETKGGVVSPADGKVILVAEVNKGPFAETPCIKISIFMSVFNVHVNRIPHEGEIKAVRYFAGKFFCANLDKASRHNEQNALLLETETGERISFVQIAGLIARRIICHVRTGDRVQRGERFGMICFGSRLDVYLPLETKIEVRVGDIVKAGNSLLGII